MTTPIEQIDIEQTLKAMAHDISISLSGKQPLLIGIHSGGVWIAKALAEILDSDFFDATLGTLNIAYY